MDSEIVSKESERKKLSPEIGDGIREVASEENSEKSIETSAASETATKSPSTENTGSTKSDKDDVVEISSDDDSDKISANPTDVQEPMDLTAPKPDSDMSNPTEEKPNDTKLGIVKEKSDEGVKKGDTLADKEGVVKEGSDSDECISQEDMLAKLGLSSVKSKKKESMSNGVDKRPLIPHKPKESIVDFLRAPKLKNTEPPKQKLNGDAAIVINGVNSDESNPGTPEVVDEDELEDDNELQAKEQLIEELRQELRNEEAKLMLLKRLQAAQNDTSRNTSKYQKEKENEKLLSSMQFSTKSVGQLPSKKGQGLPPPPPLKTHVTTAGTYQPPIAIQPKLLPKVGVQQSQHASSLNTAKQPSTVQGIKGSAASPCTGTSAIKDLQNVISSMSTNLIHPTPLYMRTGNQASVYTASSQSSPVRPTPVRANSSTGASSSSPSGYSSFPAHGSTGPNKACLSQAMSAGKQAAAKMALRKQLEKTLLQIPPPKPPPPEWSFLPSLNSTEFMTLVGFEMVVDVLAHKKSVTGGSELSSPSLCGQCGTDFTPGWKAKPKNKEGVLMCEKCSTVNVKKELKAEHTARLKAAFLKALKQEQEIEQKMGEVTPIAPKPQSQKGSSSSSSSGHQHHHVSHSQGILHRHHQHVQPGIYHHHGQQHSDSLLFQLQQQHIQQQQQELEVARHQADIRWHPYLNTQHHHSHKPQHHHSYVSDSDRQYLLDMIPSLPAQSLGYSSSRI
ncbi:predicted protein [Nematostella vectensis]|uniref:Transcriptional repressor p66 coiled-coil MBD2-interaction domain-containing protein n=1 Tax=Nematostella vectensis TaxID=45351 RepID=A7SUU6_NEMVE|nr:predicted protein [Nematostella vectensis]|eukprot:XP_001624620.1 predicted protein [Nematostella vectensis]